MNGAHVHIVGQTTHVVSVLGRLGTYRRRLRRYIVASVSTPVFDIIGTPFPNMAIKTFNHDLLAIPLIFHLFQQTLFVVFTSFDLEFFTLHLGEGITFHVGLSTRAHPVLASLIQAFNVMFTDLETRND